MSINTAMANHSASSSKKKTHAMTHSRYKIKKNNIPVQCTQMVSLKAKIKSQRLYLEKAVKKKKKIKTKIAQIIFTLNLKIIHQEEVHWKHAVQIVLSEIFKNIILLTGNTH